MPFADGIPVKLWQCQATPGGSRGGEKTPKQGLQKGAPNLRHAVTRYMLAVSGLADECK